MQHPDKTFRYYGNLNQDLKAAGLGLSMGSPNFGILANVICHDLSSSTYCYLAGSVSWAWV